MKYFNKMELISLEDALYTKIKEEAPLLLENSTLLKKIQSMIENYCEHEFYIDGCGINSVACCAKCGDVRKIDHKIWQKGGSWY